VPSAVPPQRLPFDLRADEGGRTLTTRGWWLSALSAAAALLIAACEGGDINAGRGLPVDERNPVIIANDSATDNWTGEYAMLLANSGGPPLAGIIVNSSTYWPDIADAYLLDHTVVDRVVVVSALGAATGMGWPNGDLDAWADWIVGERFRYIQINGYYDQTISDVTKSNVSNLPNNALGTWMAAK